MFTFLFKYCKKVIYDCIICESVKNSYVIQSSTYKCKGLNGRTTAIVYENSLRTFAIFTLLCKYCKNANHAEKNVESHMKVVHEEFLLFLHFFVNIPKSSMMKTV